MWRKNCARKKGEGASLYEWPENEREKDVNARISCNFRRLFPARYSTISKLPRRNFVSRDNRIGKLMSLLFTFAAAFRRMFTALRGLSSREVVPRIIVGSDIIRNCESKIIATFDNFFSEVGKTVQLSPEKLRLHNPLCDIFM